MQPRRRRRREVADAALPLAHPRRHGWALLDGARQLGGRQRGGRRVGREHAVEPPRSVSQGRVGRASMSVSPLVRLRVGGRVRRPSERGERRRRVLQLEGGAAARSLCAQAAGHTHADPESGGADKNEEAPAPHTQREETKLGTDERWRTNKAKVFFRSMVSCMQCSRSRPAHVKQIKGPPPAPLVVTCLGPDGRSLAHRPLGGVFWALVASFVSRRQKGYGLTHVIFPKSLPSAAPDVDPSPGFRASPWTARGWGVLPLGRCVRHPLGVFFCCTLKIPGPTP